MDILPTTDPQTECFLYLISCRYLKTKFIKIGQSKNLENRIKNIQTGCPHRIEKVFIISSEYEEEINGIEKYIHFKFKKYCINGEWYIASKDFINSFTDEMRKINNCGFSWQEINDLQDDLHFDCFEILLHSHEYFFTEVKKEKGKYKKGVSFDFKEFNRRLKEYF